MLWLKASKDYAIDPQSRVFAILGTGTHDNLAQHKVVENVLAETSLNDSEMSGTADVLEEDEHEEGKYVLSDYKTWGSYKVALALGMVVVKTDIENFLLICVVKFALKWS